MKTSISAAVDPNKYYWMRNADKLRRLISADNTRVEIPPKALFGVRELRGKNLDEILLVDGTRFKLSIQKSERLMDSSKEFNGRTPVIKTGKVAANPVKVVDTSKPVKPTPLAKLPVIKPVKPKVPVVVHTDSRKPSVAEIKPGKKVKLSEVELPELDDFTDDSIPEEFQRYRRVESTGVVVEKVSISFKDTASNKDDRNETNN